MSLKRRTPLRACRTRSVYLAVLIAHGTACSSGTQKSPGGDGDQDGRTYIAKATINFNGNKADIVGSFDSGTLEYLLADPTNPQTSERYQYSSVADFVAEAKVVGKTLYVKGPGTDHLESTFEYDSSKRLVRDVNTNNDETLYTAWDSSGRPTTALANYVSHGLTAVPMDISYDDVARTRTWVIRTASTRGADWTNISTYDTYGNLLVHQVNVGAPDETRIEWTILEYQRLNL
jgi:hypothetical protein